jgi:copper chaperone
LIPARGITHLSRPTHRKDPVLSAATTTYLVTGMTCSHCVMSVTEELTALDGVESVAVDLDAGSTSTVTVASSGPLDDAAVRAAVEEAGYALVDA